MVTAMWGDWLRREYRILILVMVFVLLLGVYGLRRTFPSGSSVQIDFLNDATNLVLGALIGVLSERARKE